MKKEKKIFVDKKYTLEKIFGEIKETNADRIILNISKGSVAEGGIEIFQDIQKLGREEKKEIIIESIDDHILEIASLAKLKAINPVFRISERAVSDILPGLKKSIQFPKIEATIIDETLIPKEREESMPKRGRKKKIEEKVSIETTTGEREEEQIQKEVREKREEIKEKTEAFVFASPKKKKRTLVKNKYLFVWGSIAILCIIGLWLVIFELPSAHINLLLKKIPINFSETIEITTEATRYSIENQGKIILPGELLQATQNIQMTFKANGKEEVKEKARGTLTVHNSFSSVPQILITKTRFESPNGKIFRTEKQITIPGSRVQNGKIIPSSIDIEIVADEAGQEYNIPPSSGWKIPGLKGTPKYNGFYGENTKSISGGTIGEHLSATDEDKKNAETAVTTALKNSLQAQMIVLLGEKFKTPEEGMLFQITKKEFQYPENDPENFVLYEEGEMKQFAFDETTLKEAIIEKNKKTISGDIPMKAENFVISYTLLQPAFNDEKLTVSASGNTTFIPDINIDQLKQELSGKTRSEMQQIIYSIPGLENAQTSLEPKWAFWLGSVPKKESKIFITTE